MSPPVLVSEIGRLGSLLDELTPLLGRGLPPRLQALRSNVELALARPESLETAQNQLDFIEEFADAVWGEPLLSLAGQGLAAPSGGPRPSCLCQLLESWEQLDRLSELLCQDAEAWHRRRMLGAAQPVWGGRHSPV
ncbi:MAG: hypothetical protein M3Z97_14645 [Candidatus Dormibacteraeota bacterium]|nr:hypothetical protein [Candidatus Dormibacteraeota bacterium]